MNAEMVARIIQLLIAPVVMVSACAILQGGLLSRYSAINDRMRVMSLERLDLVWGKVPERTAPANYSSERLKEIDLQLPDLLHRHRLVHDAVLAVYCAILLFVVDMYAIGAAVAIVSSLVSGSALVIFLAGTLALLVGVFNIVVEVLISHRSVEYEAEQVLRLKEK